MRARRSTRTLGPMVGERCMSTGVTVAICFAVVISIIVAIVLAMRQVPSEEQLCIDKCAEYSKRGELVYLYRSEVTAGMRSKGPRECQCK